MRAALSVLLLHAVFPAAGHAQAADSARWLAIGDRLGARPAFSAGTVRYNLPRTDLRVRVGDVLLVPAFALTSWAGFAPSAGAETMVMGDLVLTAGELRGTVAALAAAGISVTAVHNHLVGEAPRVLYVHYHAHGTAADLAARLAAVLRATATPRAPPAAAEPAIIDTALIRAALEVVPRADGPVASLSIRLLDAPVHMGDAELPPGLGLSSPINLQRISASRWVATGDFALFGSRVEGVVQALVAGGLTVTALHSHLIGEQPAVYFLHFWGDAEPARLLAGLRAAIDAGR